MCSTDRFRSVVFIGLLTLACSGYAQIRWHFPYPLRLLSEIVVPGMDGSGSVKRSSNMASEARRKAQLSAQPETTSVPVEPAPHDGAVQQQITISEDEALLLPGRRSAPPDNRARAKSYINEDAQGQSVLRVYDETKTGADVEDQGSKANANRQLNKARKYLYDQDGEPVNTGKFVQIGTTRGVIGKDGVIEMVCDGVNNYAGHIGDDTRTGNEFVIMIEGKPAKARCK